MELSFWGCVRVAMANIFARLWDAAKILFAIVAMGLIVMSGVFTYSFYFGALNQASTAAQQCSTKAQQDNSALDRMINDLRGLKDSKVEGLLAKYVKQQVPLTPNSIKK